MSRICVKNIPGYITEDRLRDQFSAKGEVTDVKIMKTTDGRSRQFAFIGYRTPDEATEALKFFDRSYIDTSRLTCEIARPVGGQLNDRPWSRYSKGSSAYNKIHKVLEDKETSTEKIGKGEFTNHGKDITEDPELNEFLHVMQPRSKSKLWANDALASKEQQGQVKKQKDSVKKQSRSVKSNKDKTEREINTTKSQQNNKSIVPWNSDNEAYESSEASSEDEFEKEEVINEATEAPNALIRDESISDLDYLKQRVRKDWSEDEEEEEEEEEEAEEDADANSEGENNTTDEFDRENLSEKSAEASSIEENMEDENIGNTLEHATLNSNTRNTHTEEVVEADNQESVGETGRLFVRNLSYTTSEEDLQELFSQFGELSQVHLVLDKETKRSKGFAYVLYMLPESASRAMEALDMSIFHGRLLHILPAKRPPSVPQADLSFSSNAPGLNQFKQDKEAQRKAAEASGNTKAWNSLFMRPDTVAENVARRYGLSKSDLLNPEAGDLAVKVALGEAQIIAETKKNLSDEGVNVEILEELVAGKIEKVKRSNRVILVKNLPFETLETDLATMFGMFGSLERIILPPTRTLAVVIFLEVSEARAAFKGLAYKRFKHVPLYLEWAPENIINGNLHKKVGSILAIGGEQVKRAALEEQLIFSALEDADLDSTESRSVFIKNLNFSTSETALKQHLQRNMTTGSLRSVVIKMKQQKSGKILSMGFGFAEFDTPETARTVCKQLQGTVLDGHALILQLSHAKDSVAKTTPGKSSASNESSTKLIVRNVAFEATKKDLQQLFSPFGQIKSLRLPKKFDGSHRGFAFLEFLTKQEASNAYNALSSTHLYGRHLVIEKAKEGESLEELRARTAMQYSEEGNNHTRPSKKQKNLSDDSVTQFRKVTG